jgi:5-carboxymethyl-2-hydroxymuconate isomerase
MPHCTIECSVVQNNYARESIPLLTQDNVSILLQSVHNALNYSGLFGVNDVKTRVIVVENYLIGTCSTTEASHFKSQCETEGFIHITVKLLSGRTAQQKHSLSEQLGKAVYQLFPNTSSITVDIVDMDKASYFKIGM